MAINFEQCLKRNLHLSHWAIIVYPKIDIIYCIAANLKISKINYNRLLFKSRQLHVQS